MSRSLLVLVTEDESVANQVKITSENLGLPYKKYSPDQWSEGIENPFFRNQISLKTTSLIPGESQTEVGGSKVLAFPTPGQRGTVNVAKMEQLEAQAIENAIIQCRGNLTEASKALGIGRATLYRKVKIYQIDPSMARKKRAA